MSALPDTIDEIGIDLRAQPRALRLDRLRDALVGVGDAGPAASPSQLREVIRIWNETGGYAGTSSADPVARAREVELRTAAAAD